MIVSHRHRFSFLKPRKTAGASLELALARACGPDDVIPSLTPRAEETRRAQNATTCGTRSHGDIAVHRMIGYGALEAEVAEVWDHLGLSGTPDLPHARSGTRPRDADCRSMYADASRDRVAAASARMIADLGYSF